MLNKNVIASLISCMLLISFPAFAETTTTESVTETSNATQTQSAPTPQDAKLAGALAKTYNTTVTAQDIAGLHTSGAGYGEISKAYGFAALSGKTVSDILGLKQTMGWGEIAKSLGVKVSDVIRSEKATEHTMNASDKGAQQGKQGQGSSGKSGGNSSHGGGNSGGHGGHH